MELSCVYVRRMLYAPKIWTMGIADTCDWYMPSNTQRGRQENIPVRVLRKSKSNKYSERGLFA